MYGVLDLLMCLVSKSFINLLHVVVVLTKVLFMDSSYHCNTVVLKNLSRVNLSFATLLTSPIHLSLLN